MAKRVVIVGATGLFGGHLAQALAGRADIELIVAGRSLAPLQTLAAQLNATPQTLDRTAPGDTLKALRPFAVIDCSGPFQTYGYDFAQAVIDAGAHYLDIADAPEFVAGITTLDAAAKQAGLTAWSGASTTPALSSAIVADLAQDLDQIDLIETAILPGNKTPRGLSVMQAILGQVGVPFPRRYGGRTEHAIGWRDTTHIAPQVQNQRLSPRRAALVNTPDVALLPGVFNARTTVARAGLELALFHRALSIAATLRLPKLVSLAAPLRRVSQLFSGFGSDAGGMRVRVIGQQNGHISERIWDMILPDGQGPKTPVQPAIILLDQLLRGVATPGARPAIAAFTRAQAEAQLAQISATFERRDTDITPIFQAVLGPDFAKLPQPVQTLHRPAAVTRHMGEAQIATATTSLAKLAALIGGFPLRGGTVPADVTIDAQGNAERWTRKLGSKTFHSVLTRTKDNRMTETFGPLTFDLNLQVQNGTLTFPVGQGRAFNLIPIPKFLTPISETSESTDPQGRFTFDVRLSLPNGALIVHYKGHLTPQ